MVGGVSSITVRMAMHVTVLLAASLTMIVTLVAPRPTSVPAAGDWVMVTTLHASVATISVVRFGMATWQFALAERERLVAQVRIMGGMLSWTVMVKVQALVLLLASLAVQVTRVVPKAKVLP